VAFGHITAVCMCTISLCSIHVHSMSCYLPRYVRVGVWLLGICVIEVCCASCSMYYAVSVVNTVEGVDCK